MKEQDTIKEMKYLKYPLPLMVGFFLLNTLFLPIMLSTILFIMHISLQVWIFPLSIVLSAVFTYIAFEKDNKTTIIALLCGLLCIITAMLICARAYDISWDGAAYRKAITGLLKYGWNPLQETFYNYAERFPFMEPIKETWYDAYPKATELWAASVYIIFENIEIGKAFNFITIIASMCICWSLLYETNVLKKWQSFLCAIFFSINVIGLLELLTFYNDGFLWEMILLFLASLTYLTFYERGRFKNICYYIIFLSINMGLNTKFSAVIFFGLTGFAFFIFWLIEKWKKYGFSQACKKLSKIFFVLAVSVIFSLVITGSTSYVINIIRHKNPFYTMIGEDSTEMITSHLPLGYRKASHLSRFICSLFSKIDNSLVTSDETIEWKFPLTFYASEFSTSPLSELKVGGWGVFFSGIFIISVVYIIFYFIKYGHKEKRLMNIAIMLTTLTIFAIITVPGLCIARYSVGMFFIPAVALVILFKQMNTKTRDNRYGMLIGTLVTLLVLNSVLPALRNYTMLKDYKPIKAQLESLKYVSELGDISIGYVSPGYHFEGYFFTLIDEGITNFSYSNNIDVEKADSIFGFWRLIYSISTPDRLSDYIKSIDRSKYLIFIAAKDDASASLTEDVVKSMRELGLKFDMEGAYRNAYIAIVGDEPMYEEKNEQYAVCNAELDGIKISMLSAGYTGGNTASIKFDGKEYCKNQRGLNIIIYNKELHHVTDNVYVDLYKNDIIRR